MLLRRLHLEMASLSKMTKKTRHQRKRRKKRKSSTSTTCPRTSRRRAPQKTQPRHQVQRKPRATTFLMRHHRLGTRRRKRSSMTHSGNVRSSRPPPALSLRVALSSANRAAHARAQDCAPASTPPTASSVPILTHPNHLPATSNSRTPHPHRACTRWTATQHYVATAVRATISTLLADTTVCGHASHGTATSRARA